MHRCLTIGNMPIQLLGSMGKRLRALREERELDQTQFAAAVSRRHAFGRPVSVSNSFVSKLEGDYKPSVEVLVALADELGVSADYILMRLCALAPQTAAGDTSSGLPTCAVMRGRRIRFGPCVPMQSCR